MSQESDRFRVVLVRAAWVRLLCGLCGVAAGLWYLETEGAPGRSQRLLQIVGYLVLPPCLVLAAAVLSVVSGRRLVGPLGPERAYELWGWASVVDAVGLLPWVLPILRGDYSDYYRTTSTPLWISLGSALTCAVLHLVVLPAGLLRVARREHSAPREARAPVHDPIRATFGRLARRKSVLLLVGIVAYFQPWDARLLPSSAWPASATMRDELVSGARLLRGDGRIQDQWLSIRILAAILILLAMACWESLRSRWPCARRMSQTRVFAAWCLLITAAAFPVFTCFKAAVSLHPRDPRFAGYWLFVIALSVYVLHLMAFTPLYAWRGLQQRSEAEREAELRERDAQAP